MLVLEVVAYADTVGTVTYEASGLARKRIAPAASSAVPLRASGTSIPLRLGRLW